jgi:hypothetical protein
MTVNFSGRDANKVVLGGQVFEVSLGTGGRFVERGRKGTRGKSPFTADIEQASNR